MMDTKTSDSISFVGDTEMARRIREHDWASSPLGPIAAWSQELKVLVKFMLASPLVASIVCGPERLLLYNDTAARLYGTRHPFALGRPLAESFPESYSLVASFYDRVFAGESVHVPAQPLDLHGNGLRCVFDAYLTPCGEEGNVEYAFMTGFEIGKRLQAEAERDGEISKRRESEDRLRLALEVAEVGMWTWNLQDNTGSLDARSAAIVGLPAGPLANVGEAQRATIHPDDRTRVEEQIRVGITGHEPFSLHYRVIHADGSVHFVASRAQAFPNETQVPVRLVGTNRDVTAECLAERRWREAEEWQAFLLKLSDALRLLSDPHEVKTAATRLLGEQLGVNRAFYADADRDRWWVTTGYEQGVETLPYGAYTMADYGPWIIDDFRAGRRLVVRDVRTDDRFSPSERVALEALQITGAAGVSLVKQGALVAMLALHTAAPHDWTEQELALLEETAERTWAAVERARAEAALRESEEKFRSLFGSINEGVTIVESVRDDDGRVTDLIYREANGAYAEQAGFQPYPGLRMREIAPGIEDDWIAYYDRVSSTGVAEEKESFNADLQRWYRTQASRIGPRGSPLLGFVFEDITERKRAEQVLRDSEAQQRFLLALGDSMRAQSSANAVIEAAARLLGERLGASRILFAEFDEARGIADIFHSWFADGAEPFPSVMRLEDYDGPILNDLRAGRTVRIENAGDPPLARPDLTAVAELGVKALLSVPLIVDGRLKVNVSIHQQEPRHWTDDEVALVQEVAERLWAAVERARAEAALRASEQRFRLLVENVQEYALVQTDPQGLITSWNPGAQRLFGYGPNESLGRNFSTLLSPEDVAEGLFPRELALVASGQRHEDARWFVRQDGSRFWARWITEPMFDDAGQFRGLAKIMRDETERERAEAFTRHSLAEKEELLKEVHHRVKNNLQVIISLLNLQATQIEEQRVLALFEETRNRVQAIASIHEQIYRSESFASIHLSTYAHQLAPELVRFYGLEQRIRVEIVGDGATLELERAVPYGMLLNELVSNACKHAFPPPQIGTMTIGIQPRGDLIELTVSDSGQGLPIGFDYWRTSSLGLKLVHGLVCQLRGTLQIQSEAGTTVQVRFPGTGKEAEE